MKRRIKRIRGTRTCGGGASKKRRGKGSRGGVGNAGAYSHHIMRTWKTGIFKGKRGSTTRYRYSLSSNSSGAGKKAKAVNVGDLDEMLDEMLESGKAEEKDDGFHLDSDKIGIERILGKGKVRNRLMINIDAKKVSKRAKEKIEEAGGKVSII